MFDRILSLLIRLAATAVGLGWLLSALNMLDAYGYLLIGVPAFLVVIVLSCRNVEVPTPVFSFRRLHRWWKGRRVLPLIFLFICLLILCGSVLYEPNNFDGLTVRIPRVLYWITKHHWHWIHPHTRNSII